MGMRSRRARAAKAPALGSSPDGMMLREKMIKPNTTRCCRSYTLHFLRRKCRMLSVMLNEVFSLVMLLRGDDSDLALGRARDLRLGRYLYGMGLKCERSRERKGILDFACWAKTVLNSCMAATGCDDCCDEVLGGTSNVFQVEGWC